MTDDDFVLRSIEMQLGGVIGPIAQSRHALERALRGSSGGAVALPAPDTAPDELFRLGDDKLAEVSQSHLRNPKLRKSVREITSFGPKFGFVVDMQDRRLRRIADAGSFAYPTFSFNRVASDPERILWPLPGYHDLSGDQFLADVEPGALPWEQRKSVVIWRGSTTGRASNPNVPGLEGRRLKTTLKKLRDGKISEEAAWTIVRQTPRFRALEYVKTDARFDFGFVDGAGYVIADTPFHKHLEKPRVSRQLMQRHKYIAVLRGIDVGSSFYWVMNSGSVGFVMETPFETFASRHFRPWEHYIPFREDLSDLSDNLAWAEANDAECREMTLRAAHICSLLARSDLRERILAEVIRQLNERHQADG